MAYVPTDEEADEKRRDLTDHMKKIQQEFADLKDRYGRCFYSEWICSFQIAPLE